MRILVIPEAIHKGKYHVGEWLDTVIFPRNLDFVEGLDAEELL